MISSIVQAKQLSHLLLSSTADLRLKLVVQLQDVRAALVTGQIIMDTFRLKYYEKDHLMREDMGFIFHCVLPNVAEKHVSHHLGSSYNGALWLIKGSGIVLDVAHLPH